MIYDIYKSPPPPPNLAAYSQAHGRDSADQQGIFDSCGDYWMNTMQWRRLEFSPGWRGMYIHYF